ncbi:MAG: 3'-5' exonuclease [Lachnospiraceae bacterium]|jgi:DNA helicase-2/ATP-dependent DNA helicase PcrA|nr:UvrD-helicase domain-containing protein [Lachnospiraceae bacterium]MEE1164021.1 3'-5' exonuclease [Lachnospiraceae bacterium]
MYDYEDFQDIEELQGLNASQLEAVTTTEGFVRVIAGAGSGKTRALSHRFAFLVNEIGILPGNILCVTFTNKSANEMRQRIHMLTGDNDTGYINTFHGFCVSVLQEDSHAVQYPKSFLVLDNADIDAMLGTIYEERGLTLRDMTYGQARDMIEIRKIFREPQYYLDMITMSLDTLREKYLKARDPADIIFYGYLYQEKKCFGLDYNDLIKFSLYIFSQNPEIRLKWQSRLEYIMIDEFQDIDDLQYELMCVLCGYHKNLFIVGDPDQTIYTWRGANVKYLLDFENHFPGAKTVMMMDNYRSTPQILDAANSLISKNTIRIKKDLIPTQPDGFVPVCHHAKTTAEEAQWIAGKIEDLHTQKEIPYRDITVLYRAHHVTRSVEEAFLKKEIPYTIYSGVQFFGRMEIKDALSYLRMIAYKDDLSFTRIVNRPRRNMGERRMAFLREMAEATKMSLYETLVRYIDNDIFKGTRAGQFIALIERFSSDYSGRPVSEVLSAVLDESGYETALRTEGSQERLDNLAELKQSVYIYETTCGEETTLEDYLRHAALFSNSDADAGTADKVRLMTIHTAKGLEFPYVFLCGMNEGIFPSRRTRTLEGMEEERRLAFVALTRARKGLYLSEAQGRNFDGSPRYPSRFVLDIDPALISFVPDMDEDLIREAKASIRLSSRGLRSENDTDLLQEGDRIRHRVFGPGTIRGVDRDRSAYIIRFDDMDTDRRITFRAKIEKM